MSNEANPSWLAMHPEATPNLNTALAKAQGEMTHAPKDSANPGFMRNGKAATYADLASVIGACRKALSDNGLAVVQVVSRDAEGVTVTTNLLHSSGESISSPCWVPVTKRDAHGYGSAITYARRYGLMALVGVAPEDDDGNHASERTHGGEEEPQRQAPQQSGNELAAIEQAKAEREAARLKLLASFAAIGVDEAAVAKRLGHSAGTIGNDEWTQLRKWYDEMRKAEEQRKTDPDEAAREVVRKQAEASLAEADRNAKTFPQVVDDLRAASTSTAVLLVGAAFPHYEKKWPTGDMKAIRRTYADRLSVVQDAEREAKKGAPPKDDVKL